MLEIRFATISYTSSGKQPSSDVTLQRYVGFQMDKLRRTKASRLPGHKLIRLMIRFA